MVLYFCYLIKSVENDTSKSTYIGFTTNPKRRLRQHNGETTGGANRTLTNRPWIHVCVVSGFPNKIAALQFEWQWQHPKKARLLKDFTVINSPKNMVTNAVFCLSRLKVLIFLLCVPLWKQLNLGVHFETLPEFKSFNNIIGKCAGFQHIRSFYCGKGELHNIHKEPRVDCEPIDASNFCCELCSLDVTLPNCTSISTPHTKKGSTLKIVNGEKFVICSKCAFVFHLRCFALYSLQHVPNSAVGSQSTTIPKMGQCSHCQLRKAWSEIVTASNSQYGRQAVRAKARVASSCRNSGSSTQLEASFAKDTDDDDSDEEIDTPGAVQEDQHEQPPQGEQAVFFVTPHKKQRGRADRDGTASTGSNSSNKITQYFSSSPSTAINDAEIDAGVTEEHETSSRRSSASSVDSTGSSYFTGNIYYDSTFAVPDGGGYYPDEYSNLDQEEWAQAALMRHNTASNSGLQLAANDNNGSNSGGNVNGPIISYPGVAASDLLADTWWDGVGVVDVDDAEGSDVDDCASYDQAALLDLTGAWQSLTNNVNGAASSSNSSGCSSNPNNGKRKIHVGSDPIVYDLT